ncbi:MAG: serine/threonine protein kinase [Coriobacteriales bacterium]|jgi:serine/threonine-protein kinase|nr:serine/threonine protein kinase [Coriobacteriales bacterium]
MLNIGTVIDDKYEVLTFLGEGGMSRVYLARDKRLNKQWAVKEIKQTGDKKKDEVTARSFVTEANTMKRIDHPMLPRIVDIVNHGGSILVVMDFIEGQSLSAILREFGAQSQGDVVEWGLELCDALYYLHTLTPPIIYRDMKPANIMLRSDGTLRIVDFGTAREYRDFDPTEIAGDTTVLGTRGYAAPEQFGGVGQTDARTDIYCLGATLYHLITGLSPADPPYHMVPIRQINPSLSPGLEAIIAKCTQADPAMRYQNCAELFHALQNYERIDDTHFKRQRRKLGAFLAAASLSAVCLLSGTGVWIGNVVIVNQRIDAFMQTADLVTDPATIEKQYLDAIDLKPSYLPAYRNLVDFYKSDGVFTAAEGANLEKVVTSHIKNILTDSLESASLSYEIGQLYLFYYSYDNSGSASDVMRATQARNWFSHAKDIKGFEFHDDAQLYFKICDDLFSVYDLEKQHSLIEGDYLRIFSDLEEVQGLAVSQNNTMQLWVAEITLNILNKSKYSFENAGISKAQQFELFKEVKDLLTNAQPETDEHKNLKENALGISDSLQEYFDVNINETSGK